MPELDYHAYTTPEPPAGLTDSIMTAVDEARTLSPSVTRPRRQTHVLIAAAVVAAAAALVALMWMSRGSSHDNERAATTPPDRVATESSEPGEVARDDKTLEQRSEPISPRLRRFKSSEAREALVENIDRAAQKRRAAGNGASMTGPGGSGADGDNALMLTKEDIRASMKEIQPLLVECYEMALETNPSLAGTLTVEFTIVGEPDVGTIVAETQLASEDGMADDADFSECITQTILSLELPAPPAGGGEVHVRYPFRFSNEDDGQDDAPTHRMPEQHGDSDDMPESIEDRIIAAQEYAKAHQFGKSLRLCMSVLDEVPDHAQAAIICAIDACNLRNEGYAVRFIGLLEGARAQMARQICLRNGIDLPVDE